MKLTHLLLDVARGHVVDWGLKSHDAMMLAVAEKVASSAGIAQSSIASTDKDFDRVTGLHVWGRK